MSIEKAFCRQCGRIVDSRETTTQVDTVVLINEYGTAISSPRYRSFHVCPFCGSEVTTEFSRNASTAFFTICLAGWITCWLIHQSSPVALGSNMSRIWLACGAGLCPAVYWYLLYGRYRLVGLVMFLPCVIWTAQTMSHFYAQWSGQ